jgi:two-component system sensor histidine kinase BaeS
MLLALVVSFIIAKGSTAPIRRLSRAASEISKGNLGHKVEVKAGGELGLLAGSFNSMAAALLQAQSLRKQFFADAAHELKTPIAVIKGNLEAMLDGVVPMERDKIASLFEESAFLNRIVDDIRYLALADSGQLVLHKKEADMQAIVEVCAERVGPALREKEQKLVREGSTDPLMTVIDADRMTQVIYNLLVNAGKYTQNGGTVGIVTERSTDNGAEYFKVTVWDNGNGISAQDVPHVFERFYRADKSRDKKTGGTGLGLAIVKKIVELHGGRVGVKSEPGKGSRFYIEIPVERKRTVGG